MTADRTGGHSIESLLRALGEWGEAHLDVVAIGLAGSHARGSARPDSDVDLIVLVDEPAVYLGDARWVEAFGGVSSCAREDYGAVQSLRVHYAGGLEVEFGIGAPSWASTDPLDDGTRQVVGDGMRVVFERGALLSALLDCCRPAD